MKRKYICLILSVLLLAPLYTEDKQPDICSYEGAWIIINTYPVDVMWIEDIEDPAEAEAICGEMIVYRKDYYVFRNKIYPILGIKSKWYTSPQLYDASRGSVTHGYDFEDLKVPENITRIRDIVFFTAGESTLGRCIYVIDENTILIHWRGWIFKAIRAYQK